MDVPFSCISQVLAGDLHETLSQLATALVYLCSTFNYGLLTS